MFGKVGAPLLIAWLSLAAVADAVEQALILRLPAAAARPQVAQAAVSALVVAVAALVALVQVALVALLVQVGLTLVLPEHWDLEATEERPLAIPSAIVLLRLLILALRHHMEIVPAPAVAVAVGITVAVAVAVGTRPERLVAR